VHATMPLPSTSRLLPYTTLFRSNMADKLNSMKVRLCAVVWDLVEMGFFEGRRAMTVLNRIENMEFWEIAEWMGVLLPEAHREPLDRKSTRLNSSHVKISYAVFCL